MLLLWIFTLYSNLQFYYIFFSFLFSNLKFCVNVSTFLFLLSDLDVKMHMIQIFKGKTVITYPIILSLFLLHTNSFSSAVLSLLHVDSHSPPHTCNLYFSLFFSNALWFANHRKQK